MGFADIYKAHKPISEMIERQLRTDGRAMMHRVGPFLKGRRKNYYKSRHAYYPEIRSTKDGEFAIFPLRAYQIVHGTYYRCVVAGKTIIPRFLK